MSRVAVGGRVTQVAPLFSVDGKALFACCGNGIKVLSVATGEQLALLTAHTDRVTALLVNPHNPLQLYSCSLDGTVRVWDFVDAVCLRTHDVGAQICHAVLSGRTMILAVNPRAAPSGTSLTPATAPSIATATPSAASAGAGAGAAASTSSASASASASESSLPPRMVALKLDTGKTFSVFKTKGVVALGVSPDKQYICAVGRRTLWVWSVADERLHKHTHDRRLTCLAFHPTDNYIATGDARGQITLWYDYGAGAGGSDSDDDGGSGGGKGGSKSGSKCVTTSMHWHAHAVNSLVFSDDGGYLLSGGEEAVLVMWQLETGHKQFLPRLGAAIHHIALSHDGKTYALSCADNSIRLIGAVSNQIERHIKGLAHAHTVLLSNHATPQQQQQAYVLERGGGGGSGLVCDPYSAFGGHAVVALSGLPGNLQWYDVHADRAVAEVVVVPRNLVSRTDDEYRVFTRIEHVLLSPTPDAPGQVLVTVDRRIDIDTSEHIALKFWDRSATLAAATSTASGVAEPFTLNTRIDTPHKAKITAAAFHPKRAMVVTASADRMFKIWTQKPRPYESSVSVSAHAPPTTYWSCQAVGFYRPYSVHDCAFSWDGSLLAVVYGQVVTLWDPYTVTLRHTLLHPPPNEHIRWVRFIPGSPFLVCGSTQTLYVWNLLTLSVWWSYALPVIGIAVDTVNTSTPHFAVAVSQPTAVPQPQPPSAAAAAGAGADVTASPAKPLARSLSFATPHKPSDSKGGAGAGAAGAGDDDEETTEDRLEREQRRVAAPTVSHLLLFTAESPVPVRVWSIPDVQIEHRTDTFQAGAGGHIHRTTASAAGQYRTARFAFVQRRVTDAPTGAAAAAGASSAADASSESGWCRSLVYLNALKQLVRFDHILDPAAAAAAAAAAAPADAAGLGTTVAAARRNSSAVRQMLTHAREQTSAFEKLYGKAQLSATAAPAAPAAANAKGKGGKKAAAAAAAAAATAPAVAADVSVPSGATNEFATLFNAPAHALPPLSAMYNAFMHLLTRHTTIAAATPNTPPSQPADAAPAAAAAAADATKDAKAKSKPAAAAAAAAPVDTAVLDAQLFAADVAAGSGVFQFDAKSYAAVMNVFSDAPSASASASGSTASVAGKKRSRAAADATPSKAVASASSASAASSAAAAAAASDSDADAEPNTKAKAKAKGKGKSKAKAKANGRAAQSESDADSDADAEAEALRLMNGGGGVALPDIAEESDAAAAASAPAPAAPATARKAKRQKTGAGASDSDTDSAAATPARLSRTRSSTKSATPASAAPASVGRTSRTSSLRK